MKLLTYTLAVECIEVIAGASRSRTYYDTVSIQLARFTSSRTNCSNSVYEHLNK